LDPCAIRPREDITQRSRRDSGCSFEAFLPKYGLDDPALRRIAEIVHHADLDDDRYALRSRAASTLSCEACRLCATDQALLERSGPVYDGLCALVGERRA
jgi:hypothetical protein